MSDEMFSITLETTEAFVEKHRALCAAQDRLELRAKILAEASCDEEAFEAQDELSRLAYELHDLHLLELRHHLLDASISLSQVDGFSLSFGGRLMHVDARKREAWAPDPS